MQATWPWALGGSLVLHLGLAAILWGWPGGDQSLEAIGALEGRAAVRISLAPPAPPPASLCVRKGTHPLVPRPEPPPAPAPAPAPVPSLPPAPAAARGPARCLTRLDPVYPPSCVRRGHEGRCVLSILVSADGRATAIDVRQSAGCPDLDQAAIAAARAAAYESARDGGLAVPTRIELAVRFMLD